MVEFIAGQLAPRKERCQYRSREEGQQSGKRGVLCTTMEACSKGEATSDGIEECFTPTCSTGAEAIELDGGRIEGATQGQVRGERERAECVGSPALTLMKHSRVVACDSAQDSTQVANAALLPTLQGHIARTRQMPR